jgi:isopenicillin N synthase-like dioxygenase
MSPLFLSAASQRKLVADAIGSACRDLGFFYVTGHGISPSLLSELDRLAREFFALDEAEKNEIAMLRGGRAWRGYFPVGGELTSGKPDQKEGLYFGAELAADDPRVLAGLPLQGANLFPRRPVGLRDAVLTYVEAATATAHRLMEVFASSLGLPEDYFYRQYTAYPTILFRVFHYPSIPQSSADWGVGEHTDYGLLTLLAQDSAGGLQVKTSKGWIEAPPIPGTLVCNIGDMLDRLTGGLYRSTPHRAKNISGRSRLSFPFFFDPALDAVVRPLPERAAKIVDDRVLRWDRQSVHLFSGTYGDYLLDKVSHVFPELKREVL